MPEVLQPRGGENRVQRAQTGCNPTHKHYCRSVTTNNHVFAYIDGFNLYYGMLDGRMQNARWLDLRALVAALLRPHQQLGLVRYFTARVRDDPEAARDQAAFIDALLARGGVEIEFGHFQATSVECHRCGHVKNRYEEKRTDVNMAARMLEDAFDDRFDLAIVVSADSDLVAPIETVRRRFPDKRVMVAFPPRRRSAQLRRAADAVHHLAGPVIRSSRLPDPVVTSAGVKLRAPRGWLPDPLA